MPTLPISSGGSRKFTPTPALTITLLILPKLRYFRSKSHWSVHIVCLLLSLSLLLFYCLPNNNFSLAFYRTSLFGGNLTKIKSWWGIFITCPGLIRSLWHAPLHAPCSLWVYPLYPVLKIGVAPTVVRSSCTCPYTQYCVRKKPMWLLRTITVWCELLLRVVGTCFHTHCPNTRTRGER